MQTFEIDKKKKRMRFLVFCVTIFPEKAIKIQIKKQSKRS